MDDPSLDAAAHHAALRGLSRLNRLSFVVGPFWRRIEPLLREANGPLSLIDIACGGGDLAIGLAQRAAQAGLPLRVHGSDISSRAIEFAAMRAAQSRVEVEFFQEDAFFTDAAQQRDIVVNSLFLHHLSREDAVAFLRHSADRAEKLFLLDDLVRNHFGLGLTYLATTLFGGTYVVRKDGPQSVRAAFTTNEFGQLAREAGIDNPVIARHWPFRQMLVVDKTT